MYSDAPEAPWRNKPQELPLPPKQFELAGLGLTFWQGLDFQDLSDASWNSPRTPKVLPTAQAISLGLNSDGRLENAAGCASDLSVHHFSWEAPNCDTAWELFSFA